jgi:phthiodiolone/phenolphthiodiolone dimycocerosates ketoreductase
VIHPKIEVGMSLYPRTPLGGVEALVATAEDQQFDSVFIGDHLQDFFPSVIWDEDFAWFAAESQSPHEWFEYQTLLGYLAAKLAAGSGPPAAEQESVSDRQEQAAD